MSAGAKRGIVLCLISVIVFILISYKEVKSNKAINNYNFQGDWICYDKKEDLTNIMHLSITPYYIKENEKIKENYYIVDKINENKESRYELLFENKKEVDVFEMNRNKIEYKKENVTYICKRSSKIDHSEDFTGKWIGYMNKSKKEKITELDLTENKIILDIYKNRLFIDAENIPVNYYDQKVNDFVQSNGNFKLMIINSKKEKNIFEFKILSNKEIVLLPNDLNQKETYFKRYNKF